MSEGTETSLDARPLRQEGVIAQEAQGQTVLLRLDDGGFYALDEVGAAIWELCDGTRSVVEIVATLSEQFDAPESTIRADVLEFVEELHDERLLVSGGA
jgi:coenzyme PQQ biosynthesis protein PqqD